jgi:glycosyltransferase involved in cell wall biosynthesis
LKTKISLVICTLNEESNISKILKSLSYSKIDEVILVDGGSIDNTISIAKSTYPSIVILELPNQGLLRQRMHGIKLARNDYLLLADADDQFSENSIEDNLEFLLIHKSDGVQFSFNLDSRTKWSTIWSKYLQTLAIPGKSLVLLGRPCIVKKNIFSNIVLEQVPLNVFHDDTWIKNEIGPKNFKVGWGGTLRKQPSTFNEIFSKLINYGKEDAKLIIKENFSLLEKTYHLGLRYPIKYSFEGFKLHGPSISLFITFVGLTRLLSMYYYILFSKITKSIL